MATSVVIKTVPKPSEAQGWECEGDRGGRAGESENKTLLLAGCAELLVD